MTVNPFSLYMVVRMVGLWISVNVSYRSLCTSEVQPYVPVTHIIICVRVV